jgi:hypothetical protein
MAPMNVYATNLAVVAGNADPSDPDLALARGEFHGTAFGLAPGIFLTAGHVYEDAVASGGKVALFRLTPGNVNGQYVEDAQVFNKIDLAILYSPNLQAEILPFTFDPLPYLTNVAAIGYAFGLTLFGNDKPGVYVLRAFKGHTVTRRGLTELPGVPPGYEVSFVPPPGLSGAPLLVLNNKDAMVAGVILKHHTAELAGRKMDLGLALDAEELLTLSSHITGGSIATTIFGLQPVPPRDGSP